MILKYLVNIIDFFTIYGLRYICWIKHITKPGKGERRGHRLVGLSIVEKIDQGNY